MPTVYIENKKRYGAPKTREAFMKKYPKLSVKRVQRYMKFLGIQSIVYKKYRPHKSEAVYELGENLLNRDFTATKPMKNG
nr:IS3 family transposase [Sporomusa ovata]